MNLVNCIWAAMIVEGIRSKSERLFERYCEQQTDIEWVYKNGDTGQQYFSVVYIDSLQKQWLFYPDYIVKKTNGDVWTLKYQPSHFRSHLPTENKVPCRLPS